MKRNYYLDSFRGFTIISMVLFHLAYNINYYRPISWYDGTTFNRIWQLSITLSFFLISGITSSLLPSDKNIKRGIKTSIIGFAITISTYIFARDQLIVWGVLNGLGLSMIIAGLIQKSWKIPPYFAIIFLLVFIGTYNIPRFSLAGIGIFDYLYENNIFILGFPSSGFTSTDYFPIIPWIFAYLSGLGTGNYLKEKNLSKGSDNTLAKIGRFSMPIYLAHQIILYPLVSFFLS